LNVNCSELFCAGIIQTLVAYKLMDEEAERLKEVCGFANIPERDWNCLNNP